MTEKIVHPFRLIIKAAGTIFLILSIIFPWTNLTLADYNIYGKFFVIIIYSIYIAGVSISFIGISKSKIAKKIEEIGIIIALISLAGFYIYILIILIAYPSEVVMFKMGFLYAFISVFIIFLDSFVMSKYLSKRLERKAKEQVEIEREGEKTAEEKEVKEREERKKEIKLINPFSIIFKAAALVFLILSLIFPWSNLLISEMSYYGQFFIAILYIIYILGISLSFIGAIKYEICSIIEKFGIILALFSLLGYFIYMLIIIMVYFALGYSLQIGYYFALISAIIISFDIFVFRGYLLKMREREEFKRAEKELILEMSDRIETKADFPERWSLIHGVKPTEAENFIHFQEVEVEKPLSTYHPNYLHLILKNAIEDLGYRIEKSQKPLVEDDYYFNYYDLYGLIRGGIKTSSLRKGFSEGRILKFILGITFLTTSLILIILNLIGGNFSIWLFLLALCILIPISVVFLLSFSPKIKGYGNIYVIEQGIAYYGMLYKYNKEEITEEHLEMPEIGFKLKISLAGAVKSISAEKVKTDLNQLSNIIKNQ